MVVAARGCDHRCIPESLDPDPKAPVPPRDGIGGPAAPPWPRSVGPRPSGPPSPGERPPEPSSSGPPAPPWCAGDSWWGRERGHPGPALRGHRRATRWLDPRLLQGEWRRSRDDRLVGGVAGGLARRFRIDPTPVRIAFIVFTLLGGFGTVAYLVAWLLMPLEGRPESIGARVVRDRQGLTLALAAVPAMIVTLVLADALHLGFVSTLAPPFFAAAAVAVLLWRNCDPEEREWLHQVVSPVVRIGAGGRRSWRRVSLRLGLGLVPLVVGVATLAFQHPQPATAERPVIGALLVVAGVVVLLGPWWLRIVRDLVAERQARVRAEDRADMAARVHDSVLQTLALIQRAADQPQKVVQLARAQERELRAWLFDGDLPGTVGEQASSMTAGIRQLASEVEAAHGVPVEVVTVGDCPLDERLRGLLAAAREATVNAAKWSGAPAISLFAEVEPEAVSVFVRDRGRGFDPDAVAGDRRGIAESIQARMLRSGGRAVVRTAPDEGTEVELHLGRRRERTHAR